MERALPNIDLADRRLVVTLPGEHRALSWAIVGGGYRCARSVVWHEVQNRDLTVDVEPTQVLRQLLQHSGYPDAIGMMTSAPLADHSVAHSQINGVTALCVATVGLSNAIAVGDPPCQSSKSHCVGTINLLVWLSTGLSEFAFIEAVSIAAEARTAVVVSARVPSQRSGDIATGTGTDCIVVAAPEEGECQDYAGTHTAVGAAIGASVRQAVHQGVLKWQRRYPPKCPPKPAPRRIP